MARKAVCRAAVYGAGVMVGEIEQRRGAYSFVHHYFAESDGKLFGFCRYYEYAKGGEIWHGDMDVRRTFSIDYLIGEEQ